MAGDVAALRSKVQQYLTQNFGDVNIHKDGDFSLPLGSTRVYVYSRAHDDADFTWVKLEIRLLDEVKETPEVFEYIALHADDYMFGHLNAYRGKDGLSIFLSHTLLGDYLDEQELFHAVGGMLVTADKLDDDLKTQFGGTRFNEE
jgi:hypothetical protein